MVILNESLRLKKELTFLSVFALSLGATLSSGFFLLPGIAYKEAGPAVVVTYLIALLALIPGILSKIELSTAMPRAGGVYYFLDRSVGPAVGTIAGIGTWLALALKVAFALVGMGAYLRLFWPELPLNLIAIGLAVLFGIVNWLGAKKSGATQIALVASTLALLVLFAIRGIPEINADHFSDFFGKGTDAILATAGMVCISYIGLTKIASVSEDMVGVSPGEDLAGTYTPVADAAKIIAGPVGSITMTIAACLAFVSVANAGILGASRYPLAMARDKIFPAPLQALGRFGTPTFAIALTVVVIVIVIVVFDPLSIAKLAAAFQLLLFAGNCLAVVVMRWSRIESYDPGYRAPLYPYVQLVGIVAPFILISEMGSRPTLFSGGLVAAGALWYLLYARSRVGRRGAMSQIFSKVDHRGGDLDRELRGILKEKGLRDHDPFDETVVRAHVLDAESGMSFEDMVLWASHRVAEQGGGEVEDLVAAFMEGTRTGATPVTGGVALPHVRVTGLEQPEMVIVRTCQGVRIPVGNLAGEIGSSEPIFAVFFLISPQGDPGLHLRLLA
ncbi:MAG: amino acid permease, partial [Planctomycetota bacterium]